MKKILTAFLIFLSAYLYSQPANDACSGAIALPAMPSPTLCNGVSAGTYLGNWNTAINGTTVNATPATISVVGCPSPDAPNDVWYSIVLKGTSMAFNVTNSTFSTTRISVYTSPSNGGCSATDFVAAGCTTIPGGNGINTIDGLSDGRTYYIQISGNDGSEFGPFSLSVRGIRDCGCVTNANISASPTPTNGYYLPGQVITFTFNIINYTQLQNNWLHGIEIINLGNGWTPGSLTPVTAPASYDGHGNWAWYTSVTSTAVANGVHGPGFFYDCNRGPNGSMLLDGNPGNNYGDNGTSHTWTFKFSLQVRDCPFTPNVNSLTFTVNTLADGESGGYGSYDCNLDDDFKYQAYYQPFPPPTLVATPAGCTPTGSVTATLNGGTPNINYSWSNGVTGTTNGTTPLVLSGVGAGVYTLNLTDANGCVSSSNVRVLSNTTPPIANAGLDQSLSCSVTSVTIGTAAQANTTYSWSPATGLSNAGIAQPTASQPNTYTLTATNTTNGCTATDQVLVSSSGAFPTSNAGIDQTLTCTTTSVTIGTAAQANTTYSWSPATGLSNAGIAQPTASQPNTYTLTATNTTNGCTATDQVVVSKDITPPVANAGVDKTLTCTATSVSIGTAAAANTTYSWLPAAGLSNAGIAQPTASQPNTYTLTATNTTNGCTATDQVVISQNITPPVANAGVDKTLTCTATSVSIGTAAAANTTYLWSPVAGLSNAGIAQPTASQPNTYTVTATNTTNGCTSTDQVVVSKDITPPVANAGADKTLTCTATSVSIGTAAAANTTYSWSPAAGLSNAGIAQPTASQPNTYTVTATNTTNGCTATDAVIVSQNITPPVANAGVDKTLTCTATSVSIGTAAAANTTYSWSPATGLSNAGIAQPTASQPNTYTVTVTNTTNGCTATDQVVVSKDITPPVANAGVDKTLTCTATSVSIGTAAAANTTYSWLPAAGLSNAGIAQPTASQPNTYTLTATNTTNGCTATDQVVISQNITPPVANAEVDKTLTCTTTSVTIGTAAQANTTYSWSPATGLSASGIAQPVASQPNTYTLTATNMTNGCTATDQVVVSQNITPPVANAGADKTLTCTTTSVSIGTAAAANTTYSWLPAAGLSNAGIAQPTASQPNTYTLTATNTTNGCTATDQVVVSKNITPPTANAGLDQTLTCTTTSVTIGTAVQANTTYSWSPAAGLSNAGIAQPTASQPNTYTVTATNTTNGCTATDQVVVSQNITPPVANAGLDQTLTCSTTSVTIGTAAQASTTYSWSPATGLSASGIAQPVASQPNTYTVTATNTTNGCTATDQVVVSQNITPPVANAGADKTLTCTTTSVSIGTAAAANTTYSWLPAAGLSNAGIAQPTASQPNTYTLTATNTTNGCTATDQVVISKNITPPTANAGLDQTLTCTTTSVTIGTAVQANTTYSWSPAAGLSNAGIAQPTASQPNTYTVTATNTTNGCTATDQVVVSQNITPPVANAGADKTLTCTTTSVSIGTAAAANTTYSWLPAAGLSNAGIAQPTASQPNTYTLTATNTTNGCTATDQVVVSKDITPPVANAGADKTLTCTATSVTVGTAAQANTTYSWSPAAGLSNTGIAQPTASQPNTYTVTATNTTNGCTATDAVNVLQNITPPPANAGTDKIITCAQPKVSIGVSTGNFTYSWSPSIGLTSPNTAVTLSDSVGTFGLTVTNPANGCSAVDSVTITIDTIQPVADAGDDVQFTCPISPVTIGSPDNAILRYVWNNTYGISATNIAQPTADTAGIFVVRVQSTINGCWSKTDSVTVFWKNCACDVFVPEAFSPNGDGINDVVKPLKNCDDISNLLFRIFNRWGEQVYQSESFNEGWNGFFKSEAQQMDSYIWTISYHDVLYNKDVFLKGVVTLVR